MLVGFETAVDDLPGNVHVDAIYQYHEGQRNSGDPGWSGEDGIFNFPNSASREIEVSFVLNVGGSVGAEASAPVKVVLGGGLEGDLEVRRILLLDKNKPTSRVETKSTLNYKIKVKGGGGAGIIVIAGAGLGGTLVLLKGEGTITADGNPR